MDGRTHDLASLLHPVSRDEFFSEYWERQLLSVQRQDDHYYQGLMTKRDIEDIISISDARYPAIRLAKDGSYYPPHLYTKDVTIGDLSFHGVPDIDKISAEYGKGATVALPALHRTFEPLSALCARLEEQLDHAFHANVYVTPGKAAGFPPHYDTHDILVLQIAGKKRWLIDQPSINLPHGSQGFKPQGFIPGPRLAQIELTAGDLLYLPRGYVHSTITSDSYSAHVTIGINVYTWVDLAKELLPRCVENVAFRKALPPGFASQARLRPALKAQLIRLLPTLPADMDHDRLLDRLMLMVKIARRDIPTRFQCDASVVSADSSLQTADKERYHVLQSQGDLILDFEGRKYLFPPGIGPTLSAMCARGRFRVAELPDDVDVDVRLSFSRYLQGIGFLRSVTSHDE